MNLSESLKSIRVLDFTRLYPGPLCTMMLADLGADVIKVEAPEGEWGRLMSHAFEQLNRNKRSLTLDLRKQEAIDMIRKLLTQTDILVESFRPGVMQRFGLDFESLQELYPRLIYCSISGYGQSGPWARRPGHDLNYISLAGVIKPHDTDRCAIPVVQIADTMGAFQAITSILAALIQRQKTGTGQFLDISLLDGALMMNLLPESHQYLTGKLACYNIYRTADDRYLAVALLESKFWKRFCRKMDLPDFSDLQFQENQAGMVELLGERFAQKSLQHWLHYFKDEDVCITPVQTFEEAQDSDYARQRGLFADGLLKTSFVESPPNKRAPHLGEHTREILEESGYTSQQIDEFIAIMQTH